MKPVLVIYNPAAGRGRARELWNAVEQALHELDINFEAVATNAPRQAVSLARQASQKYEAVVGVGGDGTVHEIVNGLLQASEEGETIPFGVVPLGTGDDFAKILPPETPIGGKPYGWQAAVQKIAQGNTKLFDAGRMKSENSTFGTNGEPHYFANGMDVGFGAHAIANFTTIPKFLKGMSAYLATVLKTMADYPRLKLRVQLDDQPPFDQSTVMAAVTNGRCFGNGFWVCPGAVADDGLFDLMIADEVGPLTILGLIPKIMKGTHVHEPIVKMYRARRVTLESTSPLLVEADGEMPYTQTHHLEVEILPRKLRIFV